jgi:hypothetical protein
VSRPDEKHALLRALDACRAHVLGILDGLSDEQLREPVLPSGWHCLGMVRHLTLSDERYWFRGIVAGESLDFFPSEEAGGDWYVDPNESADDVLRAYREEIERSNAIIADTSLDAAPAQRDPRWSGWEIPDVRYIMLHMLAETAAHAGHLDTVRELIDGRQWIVL